MVRNAVITFFVLMAMFFASFYLVLSANKTLDTVISVINTMPKNDR